MRHISAKSSNQGRYFSAGANAGRTLINSNTAGPDAGRQEIPTRTISNEADAPTGTSAFFTSSIIKQNHNGNGCQDDLKHRQWGQTNCLNSENQTFLGAQQ